MSDVSNGDIYNLLMNMRGDLGRIEGVAKGTADRLAEHITDDKTLSESVQRLQISQARQRGFITAISAGGAILGTVLGAAADYFSRK